MTSRIERDDAGRWTIHTQIDIEAPASVVWATMTDMETMPDWTGVGLRSVTPFVAGEPVEVRFTMNRFFTVSSQREIAVDDGVSFGWFGPYAPGFVDRHVWSVEPLAAGRSRLTQSDLADGRVGKRLGRLIMRMDRGVYETWNAALKAEAERRHQTAG